MEFPFRGFKAAKWSMQWFQSHLQDSEFWQSLRILTFWRCMSADAIIFGHRERDKLQNGFNSVATLKKIISSKIT